MGSKEPGEEKNCDKSPAHESRLRKGNPNVALDQTPSLWCSGKAQPLGESWSLHAALTLSRVGPFA